jgi:hypothetical protein
MEKRRSKGVRRERERETDEKIEIFKRETERKQYSKYEREKARMKNRA